MGNGFTCDDCGHLVAGADRQAVLDAVGDHEDDTGHSMRELQMEAE